MKKIITTLILSTAFITSAHASDLKTYEVTITNATSHQVLAPALIATHSRQVSVFKVGATASDGLAKLAETGNPGDLSLELSNVAGVRDVVTGSPVVYGTSASFHITAMKHDRLSLASMLATTNDGFAGLNAVALPKKSVTYLAHAYDAGSEMNNENCSHVPGPPCPAGSGNSRTASGEGFISIHNGIHGVGDLDASKLDWRGPVAVITITRIDE